MNKGELSRGKRTDFGALKPGTAVFVWNGKTYSHVGLYAGDGIVIEALGTMNGVTTTKVSASKWTHWGELAGVEYAGENSQFIIQNPELKEPDSAAPGETKKPVLRRGSKGEAVKEAQAVLQRLGYDLGPCRVDGDFGRCTDAAVRQFQKDHGLAADGIVGPLTWKELMKHEC